MDKNTIIGFLLIAAVLIGFSWWQQPSKEEIDAMRKQDSIAQVAKQKAEQKAKLLEKEALAKKQEQIASAANDTTAAFHSALSGESQNIVLKNSFVELTFNSKGGTVSKAMIKNFKDREENKDVTLFDEKDQLLNFMLAGKDINIITKDLYFTPSEQTDTTVTFTAIAGSGKELQIKYLLGKDYLLHASIQAI